MLARRARQLSLVSKGCTFYERHEILDRQGQVVERFERGNPFVYRRVLGQTPIDPEDPFLDDGSVVSQTTLGYTDPQGRWHRIVRHQRHPGREIGARPPRREVLGALSTEAQRRILSRLLQGQRDPVAVAILLREQQPAHPLPPRAQAGPAFTERQRTDTLTPLRRRLRAENHQRRIREAAPFKAWLRSLGGTVGHHATLYGSVLSAQVPRAQLAALLARSEVSSVEPRVLHAQDESSVTTAYLCSNLPSRWSVRNVLGTCKPERSATGPRERNAYLDGANGATGALAYVDAGYTGLIAGGLSTWGHLPGSTSSNEQHPALTYGIRDHDPLDVKHPAFQWRKQSRFLFHFDSGSDVDDDGDGVVEDGEDAGIGEVVVNNEDDIARMVPVVDLSTVDPKKMFGHATRCAAIAMANSNAGGDPALSTASSREARSGVARQVAGLAAIHRVQVYEMLDVINGGVKLVDLDGEIQEGIDVISLSRKESHGEEVPGGAPDGETLYCDTEADARGLDFGSLAIVYAFSNDQVVVAKSGGNDHPSPGVCRVDVEVSPPGASAAVISSGALNTDYMSAAEMQGATGLRSDSDRDHTLDGRSYPLLTTVADTCGCAGTALDNFGDIEGYDFQGHTSATAPRVAGSALIFKHWYLEQYGSIGNQAGRIIVNILNFADGFAHDVDRHGGFQPPPPYPGWGLGRLRLRLYSDAQDDRGPHWGTVSLPVSTGSFYDIDFTEGTHTLPSKIRHLRITAWWVEMNTGDGETKANIRLVFLYTNAFGTVVADVVENGSEHVLRLQYDRDDEAFPCPPSGAVSLSLYASDVPVEARSHKEPGGLVYDVRMVHVAWFWEEGEDPTDIACDPLAAKTPGVCHDLEGTATADDSGAVLTGPDHTTEAHPLRRMLDAAATSVCGTLRIASGLAGAGTGPVFEAGRAEKAARALERPM